MFWRKAAWRGSVDGANGQLNRQKSSMAEKHIRNRRVKGADVTPSSSTDTAVEPRHQARKPAEYCEYGRGTRGALLSTKQALRVGQECNGSLKNVVSYNLSTLHSATWARPAAMLERKTARLPALPASRSLGRACRPWPAPGLQSIQVISARTSPSIASLRRS